MYGEHHTEETKRKMSEAHKGRIVSKETREKIGKAHKGKKISEEAKIKMSNAKKGKPSNMKGKQHTNLTKKKISEANKGNSAWNKGKKGNINSGRTHFKKGEPSAFKGRKHSEETKKKLGKFAREKRIKEILEQGHSLQLGKNEKKILDEMEKKIGYKIYRQYNIIGYILDGYCKELNIVFEVDEDFHFDSEGNLSKKDLKRQKDIEDELNCKFIRIKDGR